MGRLIETIITLTIGRRFRDIDRLCQRDGSERYKTGGSFHEFPVEAPTRRLLLASHSPRSTAQRTPRGAYGRPV
jgi:hypothetical protein